MTSYVKSFKRDYSWSPIQPPLWINPHVW